MVENRFARVFVVVIFFALLAVCALTGFPGSPDHAPTPRGFKVLNFIVSLGTQPFGRVGGATFFAVLGLVIVWLAYRQPHPASRRQARAEAPYGEPRQDGGTPGFARKRKLNPDATVVSQTEPVELQEILDLLSQPREPGPVSAWALHDGAAADARSWLGGTPIAPIGFDWPCDPDGTPQLFLAQIDLSTLTPNPERGDRRSNLPQSGSMLIFSWMSGTVRLFSAEEMLSAVALEAPPGMPSLQTRGLHGATDGLLNRVPITLVPFTCHDAETEPPHEGFMPANLPDETKALLKDWRGHRLFGIEPDFMNNWEDLRGKSCLIRIASDLALGSWMENHSAISLWFKTEDLVSGCFDDPEVVFHSSV